MTRQVGCGVWRAEMFKAAFEMTMIIVLARYGGGPTEYTRLMGRRSRSPGGRSATCHLAYCGVAWTYAAVGRLWVQSLFVQSPPSRTQRDPTQIAGAPCRVNGLRGQ